MKKKREFSLKGYLLIVIALSWPFQIAGQIWATGLRTLCLLNGMSMVMVGVATFIAGRYVFCDGFAKAGWNWGRARHYLAVLGFVFVLWGLPTILDLAVGTSTLSDGITGKQLLFVLAFTSPFSVLFSGFGEEFGWRGYMLPRLAAGFSGRKAVLLHSVIWWAWHLPLLLGLGIQLGIGTAEQMSMSVPMAISICAAITVFGSAVPAILHGVVIAYIWMRTGSVAVAAVYHAAYDGVRDSISVMIGLGPIASLWANVVLIVSGIILLWKANWSLLPSVSDLKKQGR